MGVITNFPDGVSSFGIPLLGGGSLPTAVPLTTGKYIWLCSLGGIGGIGNGADPSQPVATLANALLQATASKGDVIIAMQGHVETISDATTTNLSKKGVSLVGLGSGTSRPTFTLAVANTAAIAVSADDCLVSNCLFVANFLSIASCFLLTTSKGFTVSNCEFRDTSSVLNFLNIVKSTGAANTVDGLNLQGNSWNGLGTTSVNSFLLTANDIDRLTLIGNFVKLARTATAAILATVTAGVLTDLNCRWNIVISQQTAETGGGMISVGGTTSTGIVANNYQGTLTTSTDIIITTTVGFMFFNNLKTGVLTASGFVLPAIDS